MNSLEIDRQPPMRLVRLDTGKRNVLGLDDVLGLKDAIAPDADAPVVVLSGRRDGFCSGLDNKTLASSDVAREELLTTMAELLLAAIEGPTRIVAVCEGHAVAAGAMLLLVADVRVGAPGSYKVGFTEPRIGMPLPALPAVLARERLDRRRLHQLTVLGRTVDPEEAAAVGFLDELAASDDLEGVARERAREIAGLNDAAYRGTVASVWGEAIDRIRGLVDDQARRLTDARTGRI
jgi:enoyl-CoA hydratase